MDLKTTCHELKHAQDAEAERAKREEVEERRREQDIRDWDDHQRGEGYKNRCKIKIWKYW